MEAKMTLKIDHVGIAVTNINETRKTYCEILGVKPEQVYRALKEH
jgi:catechol 2,3-dioxygenase-like lactoylglutathione lyase family enzyme